MLVQPSAGIRFDALGPFHGESNTLNVVIETPRGHRNKYSYDHDHGLFKLGGVLPAGAVFPFDFGFLPGTLGEDGDPVDVLVLMDESAFPGCLIPSRLIGVIEADQTESDGETMRNDRLIAVAERCPLYGQAQSLDDVGRTLLDQIEHFFVSYNQMFGKQFAPCGRSGVIRAQALIQEAQRRYCEQRASS